MLEPPPISHAALAACLRTEYGLQDLALEFLPLGADLSAAVYRASAPPGPAYFVKLKFGAFDEMSALLPRWLAEQQPVGAKGIAEVMAPLPAISGRPWAETADFRLLVYPFVDGRDGYEAMLSESQWIGFGRAMRAIHDAPLPAALARRVGREAYTPRFRDELRLVMEQLGEGPLPDAPARRLAAFLNERRGEVRELLDRTERFALGLRAAGPPFVLCHTDLHAGNLLLAADGRMFIVDWDAPLLAPRERDLMYPGGGQGFLGRSPREEEALFYAGYGTVTVDLRAVAYYRLERIVEDLAAFCAQLFNPEVGPGDAGNTDREQAVRWAMSNFDPGRVLEIANRTARQAEPGS